MLAGRFLNPPWSPFAKGGNKIGAQLTKLAYVFPGQGSQTQNMLVDLRARFPLLDDYFSQASKIVNEDLWEIIINNPDDKLNQTQFTQPILLTADVALFYCLPKMNPIVMAGHSLGEYAALVCAQAMNFADAVKIVAKRGEFMQQAVPKDTAAMAAIVGLDNSAVEEICRQAQQNEVVSAANFNSIGQVVIAGHKAAIERAIELAKNAGAKMAKLIPVSVPSHCGLMQPAAEKLAKLLLETEFNAPTIPVIQNADVKVHSTPDAIRKALIQQLTQPVQWVATMQKMQADYGVNSAIECGPGRVLAGLIKRIDKNIEVQTAETIL